MIDRSTILEVRPIPLERLQGLKTRAPRGVTLLEILVVMAIIAVLMAGLFLAVGKLRERTRLGQSRILLEKLENGIESYNLHFRTYPPDTVGDRTKSQALAYYLGTVFRKNPDVAKGEVQAGIDVGPLVTFEEQTELGVSISTEGTKSILDPWRSPLFYHLDYRGYTTSTDVLLIGVPILYSFGINKIDDSNNATNRNPATNTIIIGGDDISGGRN